jgi:hypothetical protein
MCGPLCCCLLLEEDEIQGQNRTSLHQSECTTAHLGKEDTDVWESTGSNQSNTTDRVEIVEPQTQRNLRLQEDTVLNFKKGKLSCNWKLN